MTTTLSPSILFPHNTHPPLPKRKTTTNMVEALEVMPKGLQMPAGEAPVSRKKAVPPRPDESRTWNFLSGEGPSAAPPASAPPMYYQQPKPFKPGWKERRKEPTIQPAAQRHESEQRQALRAENHSRLRFDVISDKRDYTGLDPIKGTVRDEVKAVPQNYGRRGMPERSVEVRVVDMSCAVLVLLSPVCTHFTAPTSP